MWGSQESDIPINAGPMDVSQSRAGLKKQDSSREFHSVPELKDYVSISFPTSEVVNPDILAATWGLPGQGCFWLCL